MATDGDPHPHVHDADGYVTTSDGWPVQLANPSCAAGESYGFPEFQESCDAVLIEPFAAFRAGPRRRPLAVAGP